jgi:hypothetical protein
MRINYGKYFVIEYLFKMEECECVVTALNFITSGTFRMLKLMVKGSETIKIIHKQVPTKNKGERTS